MIERVYSMAQQFIQFLIITITLLSTDTDLGGNVFYTESSFCVINLLTDLQARTVIAFADVRSSIGFPIRKCEL